MQAGLGEFQPSIATNCSARANPANRPAPGHGT